MSHRIHPFVRAVREAGGQRRANRIRVGDTIFITPAARSAGDEPVPTDAFFLVTSVEEGGDSVRIKGENDYHDLDETYAQRDFIWCFVD